MNALIDESAWFGKISRLEIRTLFLLQDLLPKETILFQYKSFHPDHQHKDSVDFYFPALDFGLEMDPYFTHRNKNERDKQLAISYRNNFDMYYRLRESELKENDGSPEQNKAYSSYRYIGSDRAEKYIILAKYKREIFHLREDFDYEQFQKENKIKYNNTFTTESKASPYEWALAILDLIFTPKDNNALESFNKYFFRETNKINEIMKLADKAYAKLGDRATNGVLSQFTNLAEKVRKLDDTKALKELNAAPFWISKGDLNSIGIAMPIPELNHLQSKSKYPFDSALKTKDYAAIYDRSWYYQRAKDAASFRI